ncbi:MAG: ATP phosphoribosyltransferase regulatory subunit, partial [Clostridia bacterium]|nr:ATP phosphoribosyltransferase regulatory subunit [Clostridia bacterium]
LKPDITLSIAKNAKEGENTKVYYNENVYRVSHSIHEYKEIPQMGIEYIGDVDIFAECEILRLARDSVEEIAKTAFTQSGGGYAYSLDISHMGFVSALLSHYGVSEGAKKDILESLGKKDSDGIRAVCIEDGITAEGTEKIAGLAEFHGSYEGLRALSVCEEAAKAVDELETVMLTLGKDSNVYIDFSIVNDMSYYNGIVFQGFVAGIPRNVLSGGRYGNLLAKMGKNASACGFALYLDLIDLYRESEEHFDADIVVLYENLEKYERGARTAAIKAIEEAASFYRENGFRVVVAKKGSVLPKAKKIIEFDGEKEVLV